MNEEVRNKARFEGSRELTAEERNLLRDKREPITKEQREELRVLESKSTMVVGWYAHSQEVRGPFHRWFTCSEVSEQYKKHVAWPWDDCAFVAGAMNNLVPLLDKVDELEAENARLLKALQFISAPTYGTELCNTDAENNEILARHHFLSQSVARQALAGT